MLLAAGPSLSSVCRVYRPADHGLVPVPNCNGILASKLRTISADGKSEVGRVGKRRREKMREEKESEERRCRCANW